MCSFPCIVFVSKYVYLGVIISEKLTDARFGQRHDIFWDLRVCVGSKDEQGWEGAPLLVCKHGSVP